VVAAGIALDDEVEAVVAVQVAEEHRVDVTQVAMPLELAERPVTGVQNKAESV
jgi:hypothetical protein